MSKTVFVVSAKPRASSAQPIQFLVESDSHRQAWADAREVCRTGEGGFVRRVSDQSLVTWEVRPGGFTVDRVLSTEPNRRGRPPKITVDDVLRRAAETGVRVPRRIKQVIGELEQSVAA